MENNTPRPQDDQNQPTPPYPETAPQEQSTQPQDTQPRDFQSAAPQADTAPQAAPAQYDAPQQPTETQNDYAAAPQPTQPQPAPEFENTAPQQQPMTQPAAPVQHSGLAITALVLGILSILSIFLFPVAMLLGLAAVIFGAIALKKRQPKGLSIAGLVTGAVGLVVAGLFGIMTIVAYQGLNERATEYQTEAEENSREKEELRQQLENQQ